jgi:CHASE2 domain-containing sensor protein
MKWLTHWSAALVTLAVLSIYGYSDPYGKELIRLKSFDVVQQYDTIQQSENVAFLEIDEATIEKYGQWPFKRDVMAEFVQRLRADGAGVIVIPILFSEKDRLGGDDALSDIVQGNGIVLAQVGTTQTNKNAVSRGVSMVGDPLPWMYAWPGMLGPIRDLHVADGVEYCS